MSFSFAPFRQEEEFAEQRALFSSAFPENHGQPSETEAFYLRKFRGFPAEPASHEYIARDAEGMVGYYAAIPFTYHIQGESFRCGMVCDVMTAPRMQGKGVFTKLGDYSLKALGEAGIDFVTGYPRRAAVIPGHLKVGWQIAFRLPLFLMPLRSSALLAARRAGILSPLVDLVLGGYQALLRLAQPSIRQIEVKERSWQAFLEEEDYASFHAEWLQGRRNSLAKDEAYLQWRLGFQGVDYQVVSAHLGGRLMGASILRRCQPEGMPALALMDLMTLGDEPRLLAAMALGWARLARRNGDEMVLTMMSEHLAARRSLWRLGFLRTPTVFSLILNCLSERAKARVLPRTEDWDLMWIDCDDL